MLINILFTGILCNELFTSAVLFTRDGYIAEFVILFIYWRIHANGHSKFSRFFLC